MQLEKEGMTAGKERSSREVKIPQELGNSAGMTSWGDLDM